MDPSDAAAAVAVHPLMRRVPPELAGRVIAVGGVVRDALLGLPPGDDLDLVVEGPLDATTGWTSHVRFGTASQAAPEGTLHIGVTRRERYPTPGALPEVEPGDLADDLARRDFTVNAMALRPLTGELIDPHGGRADLRARVIRAIRPDAFAEDPSRLVRAARYAARLGFVVEPATTSAARAEAPALDAGSARVAGELRRLLDEGAAGPGLDLLWGWGVPWIAPDPVGAVAAADAAALGPTPPWALRLGAAVTAPDDVAVPGWARAVAAEFRDGRALARTMDDDLRPSAVDRILRGLSPAGLTGAREAAPAVVDAWRSWDREPAVRGADLVAAGIAPGPAIGRALARVRDALLDGEVSGGDEQLALALAVARGEGA